MSSGTQADGHVITECELDEQPQKVWRALTESELVAQWLVPEDVDCRIIEAEPERRLRCTWRSDERDGLGNRLNTVVTFELSPSDAGGTHLRIVHEGFTKRATAANDNSAAAMARAA